MTPKQQYYKNIADTMISNLKKRGFEADYVPDRQAALRAIAPYLTLSLIHIFPLTAFWQYSQDTSEKYSPLPLSLSAVQTPGLH